MMTLLGSQFSFFVPSLMLSHIYLYWFSFYLVVSRATCFQTGHTVPVMLVTLTIIWPQAKVMSKFKVILMYANGKHWSHWQCYTSIYHCLKHIIREAVIVHISYFFCLFLHADSYHNKDTVFDIKMVSSIHL